MSKVIAAYGGGFKPPTKGHFEVVKKTLNDFPEIEEFIIYVGGGERDGINQAQSILIWEIYQTYFPMKVKIEPSKSPIGDIIRLGKNNLQDEIYFVIGGREGREDDMKDIESRTKNIEEKYPNMKIKIIQTPNQGISGTNARQAAKVSYDDFIKFLPTELSDSEKEEVYNIVKPPIKEGLNENASYSSDINVKEKILELTKHMLAKGMNIKPLPKVKFVNGDSNNAREFLGKTAYYDPNNFTITLYTEGRHPKDIVRSFSHEMIHHIQNLEDRLGDVSTTNTMEDDNIDKLEQEANLKGTMTFRNWTDSLNEISLPKATQQISKLNPDVDAEEVAKDFIRLSPSLDKKDLFQYSTYDELEQELNKASQSKSQRRKQAKSMDLEDNKFIFYKDDNFTIYKLDNPSQHPESCEIAQGAKICVASNSKKYWNQYMVDGDGVLFYIRNKKYDVPHPESVIAFMFPRKGLKMGYTEMVDYNDDDFIEHGNYKEQKGYLSSIGIPSSIIEKMFKFVPKLKPLSHYIEQYKGKKQKIKVEGKEYFIFSPQAPPGMETIVFEDENGKIIGDMKGNEMWAFIKLNPLERKWIKNKFPNIPESPIGIRTKTNRYFDENAREIDLYTIQNNKLVKTSYSGEASLPYNNDQLKILLSGGTLEIPEKFKNSDSLNENLTKNSNYLYHWTSYSACKKIIESNKLKSNRANQFFEYDKSRILSDYENVVFFTEENERFADEENSNQCILVVDKSKLSKDYKTITYGDPYEEIIVYTNDSSIPILPYLKGVLLMNTLQKSAVKKMVEFLESKGIPYEINNNLEKQVIAKKAKLPSLKKELINKLKLKYPNGFIGYLNTPLVSKQTPEYFKDNSTYSYPNITINKPGEYGGKNKFQIKFKIEPQNLEKYINWFMYSPDSIEDLIDMDNYEGEELWLKGDIPIDLTTLQEAIVGDKIKCDGCGWSWNIVDGGDDLFICHKCGHDNTPITEKKVKDPFGLNAYARELALGLEETLNEGRYDTLANKLSSIAFEAFKDIHDRGDKEGKFEFRVDHPDDEHDIPFKDFYFDFKGVVEITDDEYSVGGATNVGLDSKGEEITPLLLVKFKIPKNPDWQKVSFDIKDVVRHELEHLTQDGENELPGKYMEDDQLLRDLIDADMLSKSAYFKLEKEVDAMLQGLYFKAKKSKIPFGDVINDYLNIFVDQEIITPEEKEEVLNIWRSRRKALSLPVFENKEKVMNYEIYSDMDGVLTDFDAQFMKASDGILPSEYEKNFGKDGFWDLIDGKGVGYWVGMPWMSDGKTYWDYIKKYTPILLSSPSRSSTSRLGKRLWVKNNMPGTKLILSQAKDKQNYAQKDRILIDDRPSNIDQWRASGGIGILHRSASDTIRQLKDLGI
jgi:hypothetical protein